MKTPETQAVQTGKAACFYRISTAKQDNKRQYDDVRRYCKAFNYDIIIEKSETISGASKLDDRKDLQEFLQYVDQNKPQFVIVSELSRLARSQDALNIIQNWTEQGICFISLKENIKTLDDQGNKDPMTNLLLGILNSINIFELETIKYRVKSGMNKTALSGNFSGGGTPYGYSLENKKLVINPDQAEIINFIFEKYSEGWGANKIANTLNRRGKTTARGKFFRDTFVVKVLKNPIYKGKRRWKDQLLDEPELQIIDDDIYEAAEVRLKEKKNHNPNNKQIKHNYLLSGLIKCACGTAMVGQHRDNSYICRTKKNAAGCKTNNVKLDKLEMVIKEYIIKNEAALLYDNNDLISRVEELTEEKNELLEGIQNEKKNQNRWLNQIERIGETKFNQLYDNAQDLITKNEKRIKEIDQKLNDAKKAKQVIIKAKFELQDGEYKRSELIIDKNTIQKIINQVTVDNDKIVVKLNNEKEFRINREYKGKRVIL